MKRIFIDYTGTVRMKGINLDTSKIKVGMRYRYIKPFSNNGNLLGSPIAQESHRSIIIGEMGTIAKVSESHYSGIPDRKRDYKNEPQSLKYEYIEIFTMPNNKLSKEAYSDYEESVCGNFLSPKPKKIKLSNYQKIFNRLYNCHDIAIIQIEGHHDCYKIGELSVGKNMKSESVIFFKDQDIFFDHWFCNDFHGEVSRQYRYQQSRKLKELLKEL